MGWHFSHAHPSFQYGTCTAAARQKGLAVGRIKSDEKLLQEKKKISVAVFSLRVVKRGEDEEQEVTEGVQSKEEFLFKLNTKTRNRWR